MVIDTVILKASYDLMTAEDAMAYSVRKLADDVEKGRELQTLKLTRFVDDDGWDFLKFNFPVCGNLSSTDLMLIYCAQAGFRTYVVGNAERGRRDDLIRSTLNLDNIVSVPELDTPVAVDCGESARKGLSFTNTQQRGFAAIPDECAERLVMEMAGDQPLLYDVYGQAIGLDHDVDFAMNLNAVNLMKKRVPSFLRTAYDKVRNSRGKKVLVKENNNYAQNRRSAESNQPIFSTVYGRRNGGRYGGLSGVAHIVGNLGIRKLFQKIVYAIRRRDEVGPMVSELRQYFRERKTLGRTASYRSMHRAFNLLFSTSTSSDRAFVDATNDDLFACWDMDGLNNDFVGYVELFRRNYGDLSAVMPHADAVYCVDEVMGRKSMSDGIMTADAFRDKYLQFIIKVGVHLNDEKYLRELGIKEQTIFKMKDLKIGDALMGKLFNCTPPEPKMVTDLEAHLKTHCLDRFENDKAKYCELRTAV